MTRLPLPTLVRLVDLVFKAFKLIYTIQHRSHQAPLWSMRLEMRYSSISSRMVDLLENGRKR